MGGVSYSRKIYQLPAFHIAVRHQVGQQAFLMMPTSIYDLTISEPDTVSYTILQPRLLGYTTSCKNNCGFCAVKHRAKVSKLHFHQKTNQRLMRVRSKERPAFTG